MSGNRQGAAETAEETEAKPTITIAEKTAGDKESKDTITVAEKGKNEKP